MRPGQSLIRTDLAAVASLPPGAEPAGETPRTLQRVYRLPIGRGRGQTVAIVVAFDYPTAEQDLAVYRRTFRLPPCTSANGCFRKINQNGGTTPPPTVDPGWALEAAIDIDAVSASCPRCNILLVEANDDTIANLLTAVDQARIQGAKFISMSWGDAENFVQPVLDFHFNHPGIAFVAASGNSGFSNQAWPAASPRVTAAGGTRINRTQSGRFLSETAWSGSGSGCSPFQPKPAFQTDPDCPRRTVADISAVADPATGIALYTTTPTPDNQTGWLIAGGTSVATPLIAGMYALAGTPAAGTFPNSYPYARPRSFQDIVVGSTGSYLCTAVVGYDGPTGIGAPRGVQGLRAPRVLPLSDTREP